MGAACPGAHGEPARGGRWRRGRHGGRAGQQWPHGVARADLAGARAAGATVLVLGAAGAVGSVAVQAARLLGAGRVIAAILEGERPPPGADAVVTLTPGEDWAVGFRDASGGGGVDLIIDPVWGTPALAASRPPLPGPGWSRSGTWRARRWVAAPIVRANKVDVMGHAVFHAPVEVRREGYLRMTQHAARGDITVSREVVSLADVARAWKGNAPGRAPSSSSRRSRSTHRCSASERLPRSRTRSRSLALGLSLGDDLLVLFGSV